MAEENKKPLEVEKSLVISDEVIASIALNAAKDVEGVLGFALRPPALQSIMKIGGEALKSVKVISNETDVMLHIYILVAEDANIPTLSVEVQENIKKAVQEMTGKAVTRVNVNIAGILFSNEEEADA
ncbi:MAG: Asp23/Gls24 family envelope stress response protein [Clostridiales bacterium]|nr:Asp23/Gls24 family envelope stress response protein [Clostridiales bacterium]